MFLYLLEHGLKDKNLKKFDLNEFFYLFGSENKFYASYVKRHKEGMARGMPHPPRGQIT